MRLLWPRLMRYNILTQLTQLCLLPVCVDQWHDTAACLKSNQLDRRNRDGSWKMERAEGLLGGKFLFKRQNDVTIDKTKVVCSFCQAEFSYHRSSSSLSYHLNAKHPTEKNSAPRASCHRHPYW